MKKSIFFSFLLAFAVTSVSISQDLDKILDKHYEAVGQKHILKVKSYQAHGSALMMMGDSSPIEMMIKRPNKMLVIVEVQGSKVKQAYDGEVAWAVNPFTGMTSAQVMTGPEADGLKESSDMDGQLWDYKKKGHKIELAGSEDYDGKKVYVLKLIKESGKTDVYYIDQESYLVVKLDTKANVMGSETIVETILSDYKEVEGYLMAFTTVQKSGSQTFMTLTLDEVKFNVELDDKIFAKPD